MVIDSKCITPALHINYICEGFRICVTLGLMLIKCNLPYEDACEH
jgi:hypothetical protein